METITFEDGHSWTIQTVVTRKMRKAFRAAGLKSFIKGIDGTTEINLTDAEALRKIVLAHPESWDLDALDDAYLFEGSISWDYPIPLSLESIDSLPDAIVSQILSRMRELYAEATEETLKK
mgnify:CR=1 FL=1